MLGISGVAIYTHLGLFVFIHSVVDVQVGYAILAHAGLLLYCKLKANGYPGSFIKSVNQPNNAQPMSGKNSKASLMCQFQMSKGFQSELDGF